MKINKLPPSIYNLISAGEVVEHPASIVKELVENSIDAGASQIFVDITGGGIENITVSDNGCGLYRDDVKTAFLPHSTSKIKDAGDLDAVITLGFRGEALPSIASVSRVRLVTRTADATVGTAISLNGGIVSKVSDASREVGTTIIISGLFFNTPARARFLKSERAEKAHIAELMRKLILSNPQIHWKFSADGAVVYESVGGELINAITAIYGANFASSLIEINSEKDGYTLSGYIGGITMSRPTRAFQTALVNGRVVKEETVGVMVQKAYGNALMTRTYPVFILKLAAPLDELDVNVHPSKMEVRFHDRAKVFSFVFHAVKDGLANDVFTPKSTETQTKNTFELSSTDDFSSIINFAKNLRLENTFEDIEPLIDISDFEEIDVPQIELKLDTQFENYSFKIIGQLFLNYLIIEYGDSCFIIDQHAVQERFFYDRLIQNIKNKTVTSQPLIVPYIVDLTAKEQEKILAEAENLSKLGFDISDFGDTSIKLSAIPAIFPDINVKTFMNSLLALDFVAGHEIFDDKIAEISCRAAIKSGDALNNTEIMALISSFDPQNPPMSCPHGRPAMLKLTKREIEKMFKRVRE